METSTKYGFYLPSRDTDDIADINQISDNFRIIDEKVLSKDDLKNIEIDVDQTYNPESTNAQSGIAVAEAIGKENKVFVGTELSGLSNPNVIGVKEDIRSGDLLNAKVGDMYLNTYERSLYYITATGYTQTSPYIVGYINYRRLDCMNDLEYDPESLNAQSGVALNPILQKKIEIWQPSTHYKVGDYVLTYLSSGILDDGSGITPTALLYCIAEHTSPDVAYPNDDENYGDRWYASILVSARTSLAHYALHDGAGNNIETTYATKEEVGEQVGNIETVLDSIITLQNSLIGG